MMQRLTSMLILISGSSFLSVAQTSASTDSIMNELREVVITAKHPVTKLCGTTLVSTISGSDLCNIGTALELLAQLPMITVAENAVNVVGKGTPEIYINGRLMLSDDELTQLLSSNIKTVELDMAPGAMYGNDIRAVLRITTGRSLLDGLSVVERFEGVVRRKWSVNDMLDLNYRCGDWDIFATGSIVRNNSLIKGSTTNTLIYDGYKRIVGSSQYNTYPSTNALVKAGFNHSCGDQSFGALYHFNPENGDFTNLGWEWINADPVIRRDIFRNTSSFSHNASIYYDNTFLGNYRIHLDADYMRSITDNYVSTQYPEEISADVNSTDRRKSSLWAAKVYMSLPLGGGDLTVGTQDSYTHTSLDYRMHNVDVCEYIPSSLTDARQLSAAAFAAWRRDFSRLSLSTGLRYEYVDYKFKVDGRKDADMSRTDNMLTPDISLGYSFDDRSQLSLSYKMATVKPPYSRLTGSLGYVGIHEIEGGNPALRDEHMHDIQLFGMWRDFMLQADYIRSFDTYGFVKRLYPAPSMQLILQPVNIDVSSIDVYAMWRKCIGIWSPDVVLGIHRQWLRIAADDYNKPIFSYYFNNMISLPKGFSVTLNAYGQSRGDMHTNRFGAAMFVMDASFGKSLMRDSLQIKLSATDIFNTANNDWSMNTYGVFVDKRQSYDRRGISLSLTYRFNPTKSKYKGDSASESEIKRL